MDTIERYVMTFYDNLEKGKLVGQKCNKCNGYQVFPTAACRHCQSLDIEYVEFSKKGKLLHVALATYGEERWVNCGLIPCAYGAVLLDEGPMMYIPVLENINIKSIEEIKAMNLRLPLPVEIYTKEAAGNYIPVARVV